MTNPAEIPAGYLPPQLADELRAILADVTDTGLRLAVTANAERVFLAGNGYGYRRGWDDRDAQAEAERRSAGGPLTDPGGTSTAWYDPLSGPLHLSSQKLHDPGTTGAGGHRP